MTRSTSSTTWLVGDIGGTNARFGLVAPDGSLLHSSVLADGDYPGIAEAIEAYLAQRGGLPRPRQAAALREVGLDRLGDAGIITVGEHARMQQRTIRRDQAEPRVGAADIADKPSGRRR